MLLSAKSNIELFVTVGSAILIGYISLTNLSMALLLVIGFLFVALLAQIPVASLYIFISIAPFSNMFFLGSNIAGIPGLKIINLLLILILASFIAFYKRKMKIRLSDMAFIAIMAIIMVSSVSRGLNHLHEINAFFGEDLSTARYALTHLIKPSLFLIPFAIIAGYIRDEQTVYKLVKYIVFSLFLVSITAVVYYAVFIGNTSSFVRVRRELINLFDMHTNDLVNFYILGFPFVVIMLKKRFSPYYLSVFGLSVIGVALMYSRAGYVAIAFSLALMLITFRKLRHIILFTGICAIALILTPTNISDRALMGVENLDTEILLSGRVQNIWEPLLNEYIDEPGKLLFGNGRFSIVYSTSYKRGLIYGVGHAHNMYLDTLFDIGLVGLVPLLIWLLFLLKKGIYTFIKRDPDDLELVLRACTVSLLAYMLSGLAGRNLFPEISNAFLWIVIGLVAAIVNIQKSESRGNHDEKDLLRVS